MAALIWLYSAVLVDLIDASVRVAFAGGLRGWKSLVYATSPLPLPLWRMSKPRGSLAAFQVLHAVAIAAPVLPDTFLTVNCCCRTSKANASPAVPATILTCGVSPGLPA